MAETESGERDIDLLLTELNDFERKVSNDDDETIWYKLVYHRKKGDANHEGKLIEFGKLENTGHADLAPLSSEGYTHYGIFRLTDRSTTTIVESEDGNLNKVFSFSRSDANVSHDVEISPRDHKLP
ncbi:hypothetical protein [Haloprofundus halophilus]|uniref:hypothetical protein n=1 Tax=Haloprofundus halophilus TaxID=2283527 RepID=UPI0013003376|nr:hypothetical protein [Haloprofundus halophilus]